MFREELRTRLKELRDGGKLLEAQRLEQRTMFDMEMMKRSRLLRGHRKLLALSVGRQAGRSARACSITAGQLLLVIE